ncbi:MAG: hypothetical protein ABIH23_18220 [bacterium]
MKKSDTCETSSQNVVKYIDGTPVYELTGEEIVFPIQLEQGGVQVLAYFHMDAQYRTTEVRGFIDDLMIRYRDSDSGDRDIEFGEEGACAEFVKKHFRGISGVDGNPSREECLAWLGENPNVLTLIWSQGYSRVLADDEDDSPAPGKLVIGSFAQQTVKTKRLLYCPANGSVQVIRMKHVLKRESEADRITHRKAMRQTEKGKISFFRFNWDVLDQLYAKLILRVEGMTCDGDAAHEDNPAPWPRLVPLPDKISVISKVFSRTAVKNG